MPVVINGSTGISGVDGSAGTPAFQGSDNNTGIRFGADIVSLVTGGSDRLYIDSSGRLGVGTSSPSQKMHLEDSGSNVYLRVTETGNTGIDFGQATDGNGVINLRDNAAIQILTNNVERVRINSTGVGIGTTSPSQLLEVAGSVGNIQLASSGAEITFTRNGPSAITASGASGSLLFQTGGTNERARIDSSGRLLVGTSTSAGSDALQQISGVGSSARPKIQLFHWEAGDGAPQFIFSKSRGSSFGSYTAVNTNDELGGLFFQGSNGTTFGTAARIDAVADAAWGTNDHPGRLVFSTTADGASSPTERMRITSGGKVWIGLTSSPASGTDSPGLELKAPNATSGQWTFLAMTSAGSVALGFENSGFLRSDITYNTTTATAANINIDSGGIIRRSTSSIKYKRNVINATYGLSELMQLRPVTYQSKADGDGETVYGGLIAEEVDAAGLPEFVQYAEDGSPDALAYGNMVSLCIKAIQEQQATIADLQAKVAALESA